MSTVQEVSSKRTFEENQARKQRILEIIAAEGIATENIVNYQFSFGLHRAAGPYEAGIYVSPIELRIVVSDKKHHDESVRLAEVFEARTQEIYLVVENYC